MINVAIEKSNKLKTYSGSSAFITFTYNAALITEIKKFTSRYYHPENKEWEIQLEDISELISKIQRVDPKQGITITGKNELYSPQLAYKKRESGASNIEITNSELKKFGIRTDLLKHQLEALKYGEDHPVMYLADEPGAGKTLTSIAWGLLKSKEYKFRNILVVCGVNNLKWNYYNEVKKHTEDSVGVKILGMRYKKAKKSDIGLNGMPPVGKIRMGGNAEKIEDLERRPREKFLITNIESLRNKDIVALINSLIQTGKIGCIIMDEAHKVVTPNTQQTQGLLDVQPPYRMLMSGTPLMNHPLDLYVPLTYLGVERNSFYKFKRHYANLGEFESVLGYKNLDQLQEKLDSVMVRRLKKDIYDLPEKTFSVEYVEMDALQEKLYLLARDEVVAGMDEILKSPNPLVNMLRMRQATGNTWTLLKHLEDPSPFEGVKSAKLERLKDMVAERVANNRKILIFSNWTEVILELERQLQEYRPLLIYGGVGDIERNANEKKFQSNPDYKVLIGNIKVMGTGLTLTAADTAIFMDDPWTWSDYEQASDRIHRIGTTSSVDIISLITSGTIDERIHMIVQSKKELSDFIVDGIKMGDKKNLIKFLIGE